MSSSKIASSKEECAHFQWQCYGWLLSNIFETSLGEWVSEDWDWFDEIDELCEQVWAQIHIERDSEWIRLKKRIGGKND